MREDASSTPITTFLDLAVPLYENGERNDRGTGMVGCNSVRRFSLCLCSYTMTWTILALCLFISAFPEVLERDACARSSIFWRNLCRQAFRPSAQTSIPGSSPLPLSFCMRQLAWTKVWGGGCLLVRSSRCKRL